MVNCVSWVSISINDGEGTRHMEVKEETITISLEKYNQLLKDYQSLLEKSAFLAALETMGVNNWEGYSEACKLLEVIDE